MSLADLRRVLHVPGACGKEGEATTKSAHAGQSSRPGQAGLLPARQEVVEATVPDADRLLKRAAGAEGRAEAVASWAVDAVDVVQWIVHRIVRRHRAFSDPLQASLL